MFSNVATSNVFNRGSIYSPLFRFDGFTCAQKKSKYPFTNETASSFRKHKLSSRRNSNRELNWLEPKQVLLSESLLTYGYDSIDISAVYESQSNIEDEFADFNFNFYMSLLPIPFEEWCPQNSARDHPLTLDATIFPLSNLFKLVEPRIKYLDFVRFLAQERMKPASAFLMNRFHDPITVVQSGFSLLRKTWELHGRDSREFAYALMFIGSAATQTRFSRRCDFCFRRALPGLARCGEHTQSKFVRKDVIKDAVRQAHRARTGKKTAARTDSTLFEASALEPDTLAGIIWGGHHHSEVQSDILSALAQAPLVRNRLSENFDTLHFAEQLDSLRIILDPNHWDVKGWPKTIENAQKWFEVEEIVSPGSRRKGLREKNKKLAEKALSLLSAGAPQKEIAIQLEVSESNLSHLLKRYRQQC